ncbi:CGGC domain-containing protein [Murimonas intestini]|uniref:Metal-binding protein n=1 Tax=Murimonas intestini TaxID=1337051 RepID=A0AB73T611_9FIRM|nr:CGGC domain-containing protein [Murimonas intestini]MCR1841964.1 CGGC domain-containing protein [Murimonas intestini]MCR1865034.1 CGGC domain-containing protein [Murimonas intestini]MCR1885731.1 CGGC domain-containing protein [Murimonas intestini]
MKKIAMLNCLKANEVCTGAACMKAFNEKSRSFERYREEETVVAAFMRCNGCDAHPGEDKGLQEKLDRLVKEGVQAVHAGICTKDRQGEECPVITDILSDIESRGIEVIRGTH